MDANCQTPITPDNVCLHNPEVIANLPGGDRSYNHFVSRHLNTKVPVKKKAPKGLYTIIVKFMVNVDGTVSDVTTETDFGYGMEEEAMRVMKLSSPHWTPALCNGKNTRSYRKALVSFNVE